MRQHVDPSESTQADQALVLGLAAAVRTAGYFNADNDVMREVCAGLADQLQERAAEEGVVRIAAHSHSIFLGSARIRSTLATYERFATLIQLFAEKGISSVSFHTGVSRTEVAALALMFARESAVGPGQVNGLLHRQGVTHIETDLLASGGGVQAMAPVEAYAAAVQLGAKLRERAEMAQQADMRQVRRITQLVVDQVMENPGSLMALTTVKEIDDKLISHSANVAILSVLVGGHLGLNKSKLGELCLSGFLHDAGKLEVSSEVLGKPGALEPHEWEDLRRHPVNAARNLLSGRRLTPAIMRAVVVAYEHHLDYDMKGYPKSQLRDHVTLFGNIIAVADRYDALTTARAYRRFSFSPHEVIGYLLYYAGTSFDPMVVKLFVELVGLFPPGTLVRLNDGDLALVCTPPAAGEPPDQPRVRMWTGKRVGESIHLGPQPDGTTLSVAGVLSPAGMGQVPVLEPGALERVSPPATR